MRKEVTKNEEAAKCYQASCGSQKEVKMDSGGMDVLLFTALVLVPETGLQFKEEPVGATWDETLS